MTAEPGFLRLEKTSLREQALSALRKAITTGQIQPGTHLVETELSEALQISRGTLREAMRQLQQEGLISAGARGRLSVRHLDTKEIRDIFGVRAALEALAASELASRPDRADVVAELRGAVEDMERWAASNLEDRIEADLTLPPDAVPAVGQRDADALVVVAGGQHPDVDHVRRRRTRAEEHGRQTPLGDRRRDRVGRRRPRRPTPCAPTWLARRRCSSTARPRTASGARRRPPRRAARPRSR